ncbi:MAG: hypothetical protein DCF31_14160 [Alphaproteobacteria bacterium]|nr:MAG: hypothetical protein DCF31_14160 [Alphaproteobacteria bacterium]
MKIHCIEDRRKPFVEVFQRTAIDAGYALTLGPPARTACPGYAALSANYVHLSPNTPAFELACFRRYFDVAGLVADGERAIISDSDIYVQSGPGALPASVMDLTADGERGGVAASIGMLDGVAEYDASPHFSFWTGQRLRQFCDYLVTSYTERHDQLRVIHDRKLASGAPYASVSDMTLIRLWSDEAGVPLINTNRVEDDRYLDHNISTPDTANSMFRSSLGRKTIQVRSDGIYYVTAEGRPLRPATLHLQGRYKVIARALEKRSTAGVLAGSAYIAAGRFARRLLLRS